MKTDPILRKLKTCVLANLVNTYPKYKVGLLCRSGFPQLSSVYEQDLVSFVQKRVWLVQIRLVKEASVLRLDADCWSQTSHSDHLYKIFLGIYDDNNDLGNIYAVIQ
mgnify:CR=1 FL=1